MKVPPHTWVVWGALAMACGGGDPPAPGASSTSGAPAPAPSASATQAPSEVTPSSLACTAFPDEQPELFGAKLETPDAVTLLAEIVKTPDAFAGKTLATVGVVRASCLKRGCWMEVRPEDDRGGAAITVRFKDYKFFVPLSSRGAHVAMQGKVLVTTLSAEDVAHMESEGATVAGKLPDGTAKQIQFTATGVEMCGRKK